MSVVKPKCVCAAIEGQSSSCKLHSNVTAWQHSSGPDSSRSPDTLKRFYYYTIILYPYSINKVTLDPRSANKTHNGVERARSVKLPHEIHVEKFVIAFKLLQSCQVSSCSFPICVDNPLNSRETHSTSSSGFEADSCQILSCWSLDQTCPVLTRRYCDYVSLFTAIFLTNAF